MAGCHVHPPTEAASCTGFLPLHRALDRSDEHVSVRLREIRIVQTIFRLARTLDDGVLAAVPVQSSLATSITLTLASRGCKAQMRPCIPRVFTHVPDAGRVPLAAFVQTEPAQKVLLLSYHQLLRSLSCEGSEHYSQSILLKSWSQVTWCASEAKQ
jgi:hypothetical protein